MYIDPKTNYVASVGQREEYTFYRGGKEEDRDETASLSQRIIVFLNIGNKTIFVVALLSISIYHNIEPYI
jgi:hypothetical protein